MSREGRSQPIQPFAAHGFLGNTPANGVLPPRTVVVVEIERRRTLPLPATVLFGAVSTVTPTATPPAPVVVENVKQRQLAQPPVTADAPYQLPNGVGDPGTAPPAPLGIDRVDQRHRYRPLDPIILSAALAGFTTAPAATPPGPFVVPLDERRRFLAQLPPTVQHGYDDTDPPLPTVVGPDDRTRKIRVPDPTVLVGPAPDTTQQAAPPAPTVVLVDGVRRLLPQTTFQHGYLDPGPGPVGTTPPPVNVTPLVERRMFFVALAPFRYVPFVEPVVSPAATGVNQDFASIVSGW